MRILHTSDWHLGKRLESYSRLPEQQEVLEEIAHIAITEQVDAILIAGDLYDTFNPPSEATELFYKQLKSMANNGRCPVIAIAGNHDSPDRIAAPDPLARACGIMLAGYPQHEMVVSEFTEQSHIIRSDKGFIELQLRENLPPLRLIITPYANEYRMQTFLGSEKEEEHLRDLLEHHWGDLADKYCDTHGVNILMTHLFMIARNATPPPEPEDEKPICHVGGAQAVYSANIPPQIQYVALGHLHRQMTMDTHPCPVVYSGSPLSYSFSEADQQKYIIIIDAEPGQPVTYTRKPLTQGKSLKRLKAHNLEEAEKMLSECPDALIELTMVSDTYLSGTDRKTLNAIHPNIISLIPEVKNSTLTENNAPRIDLSQSIEQLFDDYFKHKKGQEPNEELKTLLLEVLGKTEKEEKL